MIRNLLLFFILIFFLSCKEKEYQTIDIKIHAIVDSKIDTLNVALKSLENTKNKNKLHHNFIECRKTYKKSNLLLNTISKVILEE